MVFSVGLQVNKLVEGSQKIVEEILGVGGEVGRLKCRERLLFLTRNEEIELR